MSTTTFLTDGGIETDLIYRRGVALAQFATVPPLRTDAGRVTLRDNWSDYAALAHASGLGLIFAVLHLAGQPGLGRPARLPPPPVEACAAAGAESVTANTMTYVDEPIGIVRAAREVGLPVAISFTIETDGRLPNGVTLADAIAAVDAAAAPDYVGVNCAHPDHLRLALQVPEVWRDRIEGLRGTASRSHAELDASTELDDGDPEQSGRDVCDAAAELPSVRVLGGCCGTDTRHIAAVVAGAGSGAH